MNIYLEIFGYIGSALLMVSIMMTSMVKFRIINIIGSIISTIYSIVYGAYAVVFLNFGMMSINIFQLIRELCKRRAAKKALSDNGQTTDEQTNSKELEGIV